MTNANAFMQFLEAEGVVREGFRDGKAGWVVTPKGRDLDKAAQAELAWRYTLECYPNVTPLQ